MERRGLCLVLWRCGSPIGQAQTVFGHAVGEVLQVGLKVRTISCIGAEFCAAKL